MATVYWLKDGHTIQARPIRPKSCNFAEPIGREVFVARGLPNWEDGRPGLPGTAALLPAQGTVFSEQNLEPEWLERWISKVTN